MLERPGAQILAENTGVRFPSPVSGIVGSAGTILEIPLVTALRTPPEWWHHPYGKEPGSQANQDTPATGERQNNIRENRAVSTIIAEPESAGGDR
ncbi:hypothetical protein [Saccharopolyspora mangrovi]|uniref:Uncharacterized protein n=1 Tax=Saccharopolyspora mangrovi TaxID=3082379 RepID=A0ABU6A6E5_9PSEU|nr:hypothetical protein [Saccharopolyspora sp. S2-29]MEB3367133.1 hypothetical protein [Saccharopolyspora sp. S2-29]